MHILIVEDEQHIRTGITDILTEEGFTTTEAANLSEAQNMLRVQTVDAVLCDVYLPDGDGIDLLTALSQQTPRLPCIIMTAFGNRDLAVRALEAGAYDYVAKPLRFDELLARLRRLEEQIVMRQRIRQAESEIRVKGELAILGNTRPMQEVRVLLEKAAAFATPVLIEGEAGAGKELVARLLHSTSFNKDQPFVRMDCASIPQELMESELFGHKRGAFPGADRDREGLLATADRGTLFLGEIGKLPTTMQAKLLHVLDEHRFRSVGGTKEQDFQARVIASSNHDLKELVKTGAFRQDFYYRLDVLNIRIPPLRERHDDIVPLAICLLKQLCKETAQPAPELSPDQCLWLQSQPWPGNVRELRHVLEKALLLSANAEFILPFQQAWPVGGTLVLAEAVQSFERSFIQQTIASCHGDKAEAARRLGIGVSTLYRKLENSGTSE